MTYNQLTTLLGLGAILLVALGAAALLLRTGNSTSKHRSGVVQGYPLGQFPARHLTSTGPLAALATTQLRLLAMYEQIPPHSDLAIWLRTFLHELRAIMDTGYRVALITRMYGQPVQLERLVAEVQQIEAQLADHAINQLLARDADAQQEQLEARLQTLRLCVRELAQSKPFVEPRAHEA